MNLEPLLHPAGPHLHALIAANAAAYDGLRALESRGSTVRFIRGHKAQTSHALFDELAAALQFPFYFGENWDAVNDCLSDAHWLHEKDTAGVIVFFNAPALLQAATPADAKILIDTLTRNVAPRGTTSSRASAPVHVVFQGEPNDAATMTQRWPSLALLR